MKMTKEELSIRKREQMHGPILISLRLLRWVGRDMDAEEGWAGWKAVPVFFG